MANAEQIKRLVKKRGTIKSQITSFKNFLAEQRKETNIITIRITSRLQRLKEAFIPFDSICDELDNIDEENDHTAERITTEENYIDAVSEAENLLNYSNTTNLTIGNELIADVNRTQTDSRGPSNRTSRLKLPETSLPKFDGKYEQWLGFKDSFVNMIDDCSDLSNVEKLQYLKSCLSGEAARNIEIFTITNENYERAWKLLKDSYQDERIIISRHLSLLLRMPVQETETAAGLTRLADETQQHVLLLKSLDVDVGEHIIVQNIMEKLPRTTKQKWDETLVRGKFPELKKLIEF